jgi:hypothetical protein
MMQGLLWRLTSKFSVRNFGYVVQMLVLTLILLLTACGSTRTTVRVSAEGTVRGAICDSFRTIMFAQSRDSKLTVAQIREYNAVLATYNCGEL